MSEAILGAIISGVFSLLGVYFLNKKNTALISYRIEQLEKKQDAHNNMIERMYKVEGRVTELEHDYRDMKGAK